MNRFTNSGTLFRFILRRDRVFLPLWMIGIVFLAVICVPLLGQAAKTPTELVLYGETMKNPAMIAMCGPQYAEPYTYGIMYTQMMTVWILILMGVMNFFLVSRHTRRDEEDGKIEVLRSLPVGRLSILSSVWAATILANLLIGLLCAVGFAALGIEDMGVGGCFLLGGIFFGGGMFFAAVAMLFSQLCATSRGLVGGSFLVLGVLYVAGAMGNVRGGALVYVSPFSLMFKTAPFAGDHLWPVFIVLAETLVIAAVAMRLSMVRDLGAGLLPQRKGRAHAGRMLSSTFGLAWRLTGKTAIIWVVAMLLLGASYGSIFGDFEDFLNRSELLQMVLATGEGENMLLSFMTYITLIMANVAAIPVINCVLKLRGEEKRNRLEPLYARSVSRVGQFVPYVAIAIFLSVLLQLALSFGLWFAVQAVMAEPLALSDILLAGIVKLPGIWLLAGVCALLTGLLPKWTSFVWLYFGLSFFVVYIGRMMDLPSVFVRITAFGALPDYPVDVFQLTPFAMVTMAAAALMAVGGVAYGRRELRYQ